MGRQKLVLVQCVACGSVIDDATDYILTMHAIKHTDDDLSFRATFNDSPITFPIQFNAIEESDED